MIEENRTKSATTSFWSAKYGAVLATLIRIGAGYIGACVAGGLCLFVIGFVFLDGGETIDGLSFWGELLGELPWIAVFAAFISVLAMPVAIPGIIITEMAKLRSPIFFAAIGALAVIPALFLANNDTMAGIAEGFAMLAPAGIIAGLAFWLVRHRLCNVHRI